MDNLLKIRKNDLPTYIFVDASNIRNACSRSSKFELDFTKLLSYQKSKYLNLIKSSYFEWLSTDDIEKKEQLSILQDIGYTLFLLERKSYRKEEKKFKCKNCGTNNIITPSSKLNLKSNIDVYLCSAFVSECFKLNKSAAHFILVSCDGDFAEMIKECSLINENLYISVLATPYKSSSYYDISMKELKKTGNINFLSERFSDLSKLVKKFELLNIETIRDYLRITEDDKELVSSKISISDDILEKINKKSYTEVEPLGDGNYENFLAN